MKFLSFCFFALWTATALPASQIRFSEPVDGIYAQISWDAASEPLPVTSKFRYCFLTTNESGTTIFFPKREYFCRLKLIDPQGPDAAASTLGKKFGEHFPELREFSTQKLEQTGGKGSDRLRPKFERLKRDVCAGEELPPLQQLFDIQRVGTYKLEIQFQVFKRIDAGTNKSFRLVTLPPVSVPVINPGKAQR